MGSRRGYFLSSTPEGAKALKTYSDEMRAAAKAGMTRLPQGKMIAIFGRPSEDIASRAAAAEQTIVTHGAGPVQMSIERPRVRWAGSLSGALTAVSGVANVLAASQSENKIVRGLGEYGGASEVAGGLMYGAGALKVGTSIGTTLMQTGRIVGGIGGGLASSVVSGYALAGDIQRGDVQHAVGDVSSAAGGAFTLIGTTSTALGATALGALATLAASVAGAFSAGYGIVLINKGLEPLIDKAAPGSGALGDLYYRAFPK